MNNKRLYNKINTIIENKLGLIMFLLGLFICVSTTVMIVANCMITYITGTITLVTYLLLLIKYVPNKNSKKC